MYLCTRSATVELPTLLVLAGRWSGPCPKRPKRRCLNKIILNNIGGRPAILISLFSLIWIAHGKVDASKKIVCVIGAGPNGLVAIKHLADNPEYFVPIGFETKSDVGGMWIYTDDTNPDEHGLPVQSSIYRNLRTTDAKEFMSCPDFQEICGEEYSSIKHETVLDYLRNYTEHFNLRKYIQFDTMVERIRPISSAENQNSSKWLIQFRKLNTNEIGTITCDATMIATGCYNKEKIPRIPGIDTFPGLVIHSHVYRRPDNFTGQTVVILGASVSGLDIAFDLSKHVKTVYLSHRHNKISMELPKNVIQVAGVVAANGNELMLQDGSHITADSFIYCTGYTNELKYLDFSSGIEIHDNYLYPLYRRTINVQHPSMAILGFTRNIMSFCPKMYAQTRYYLSYLQGEVKLPSRGEMLEEAKLMTVVKMPVTSNSSWAYVNQLIQDGKFEPIPKFYTEASVLWEKVFSNNRLHYKEYKLIISDDGTIKIIHLGNVPSR